ncbi:WG containing repeat-containing protein, partial [Algoriphagus locisalis]
IKYDNIGNFGSHGIGWALVQKDKKVGFINTKGEEIVSTSYDNIGNFGSHEKGWALVQKGRKFGYINTEGEVVVPVAFDNPDKIAK